MRAVLLKPGGPGRERGATTLVRYLGKVQVAVSAVPAVGVFPVLVVDHDGMDLPVVEQVHPVPMLVIDAMATEHQLHVLVCNTATCRLHPV